MNYPVEVLKDDYDDGTMTNNVSDLESAVVGHRIVKVEKRDDLTGQYGYGIFGGAVITLDDGTRVEMANTSDCCAHTDLEAFLLHPDRVDHIITGVGTTDEYGTWHIYADMGDVLELKVGWSAGNPFYYGYGFDIWVKPAAA